jgi:hypothetical protein
MSEPDGRPSPSAPDAPPDPDSLNPDALDPPSRAGIDDDADRARGDLDGVERIAEAHRIDQDDT